MKSLHKTEVGSLVVPFVIVLLLFLAAAGFGGWAYMERQDYKDNSDQKAAVAAEAAKVAEGERKDKEFAEAEKSPFKTFRGSETLGSISFQYPKTWSAYIAEDLRTTTPVQGYFHPEFVPLVTGNTLYALRSEVVNTSYTDVLKTFDSAAKSGKAKISAFRAEKVQSALGVKIEGEVAQNKQGIMVLLPLRDKSIKFWTENSEFYGDFNNTILPSLTFIP